MPEIADTYLEILASVFERNIDSIIIKSQADSHRKYIVFAIVTSLLFAGVFFFILANNGVLKSAEKSLGEPVKVSSKESDDKNEIEKHLVIETKTTEFSKKEKK